MATNKTVTNYWLKYYTNDEGICKLCDNIGFVNPFDSLQGHRMPCICPNGQSIRANYIVIDSEL
jgi:hypothetical protein